MTKSIVEPDMASEKQYLGIDYGDSKVGLALADAETKMAFAYGVLKNTESLAVELADIIDKENIGTVVIGVPKFINHKKEEYAGEGLGKILKESLDIEVEYQNEMFTTKMAQANLIEQELKDVKRFDDQEAARIILQEWIDSNK